MFIFILSIVLILISSVILFIGIKEINKANQIVLSKDEESKKLNEETEELKKEIFELSEQKYSLLQTINNNKELLTQEYERKKNEIEEQIKIYKEKSNYASEQYVYCLEKEYEKVEKEFDKKLEKLQQEEISTKENLQKLKDSLSAGVQAQLREKEKQEEINFYKLQINKNDLSDIEVLNKIKYTLHQPVILNKLIWTQYFQKQTTEMCNRILGTSKKCGIYKITNLNTKQCYIGQSVDISTRWKDHIKCGLGIDASATNKLYKAMQDEGVWNFSFELIEECSREQLNEKEKMWIAMYQSDKFGYNLTKGNK